MKIKLPAICILLFLSLFSVSQEYKFKEYGVNEGVSQGNINVSIQDSSGFMWFGTQDGLNRFDGYEFKVYKPDPDDKFSLRSSVIKALYETRDGKIWVGTAGGGLNVLDKSTGKFKYYINDESDLSSLSHDDVYAIFEDKDTVLWVGTLGGGLCKFDYKTEKFTRYQYNENDPYSLSDDKVRAVFEDHDGNLWVGLDGGGINKFDQKRGRFIRYMNDPQDPTSLSGNAVLCAMVDYDGTFWIGTWAGGISHFDPRTGKSKVYRPNPDDPNSISNDKTFDFWRTSDGKLWICTRDGLDVFNEKTETFTHYKHDPLIPTTISKNILISLYEDNSGVLWVGTEGAGLNATDIKRKRFHAIQKDINNPKSLNDNEVTGIFESSNKKLYISTFNGGVNIYDWDTEECEFLVHNPDNPNSICNNFIQAIEEDSKGNFWFGSNGGGLSKYIPSSKTFENFKEDKTNPKAIQNNVITSIEEDRYGLIWYGTWGAGIGCYSYETGAFKTYTIDKANMANVVLYVMEDSEGVLWAGSFGHGLLRFDREKDKFIFYENDKENPKSISNNVVYTLLEDKTGDLWIGTGGSGIDRFNKKTGEFTNFNKKKNGLVNDMISGMRMDDSGNLWISTVRGMTKFNIAEQKSVKNFDIEDGLVSNDFTSNASFKAPNGNLFFGGGSGVTYFHPDSIVKNQIKPAVVLTDFKLFNESQTPIHSTVLKSNIEVAKSIELSYKQDVISFEFSALHFVSPIKNSFKYKMEGFDEDWISTTYDRRFAKYTNLPGGEYVFRVIASNNDDVWNEEGVGLKIIVIPPYYQTVWFYVLVFIVVAGLFFQILKYQKKQARIKQENLQKKIDQAVDEVEEQKKEILKQNEELFKRQEEDKQRRWFNEGIAKFGDILRMNKDSLDKLANEVLNNLVRYVEAAQGGIYTLNDDDSSDQFLQLIASYAYNLDRLELKRIEIGETLVGNCFKEEKMKHITNFPDNYLKLESALGHTKPKDLLLVPLKMDDKVLGVLEISSINALTSIKLELIEKLAESIASQLFTTRISLQTQRLLQQSQQQAEELRAQEEETRQNIEEMEATKEEAERLKSEALGFLDSLDSASIRANFSLDGKLEYANTKFLNIFNYSSTEVLGSKVTEFIKEGGKKEFKEIWSNFLKTGKPIEKVLHFKTKDGSVEMYGLYSMVKNHVGDKQCVMFVGIPIPLFEEHKDEPVLDT